MSSTNQHNWKLTLGIILLLVGQVFSVAHAGEFGSVPHEHNGVVCVATLADEFDNLVPAATIAVLAFNRLASALMLTARVAPATHPCAIRPPATGPPSI